MARYGTEQKPATRRRILASAGRRFKRDGIGASGISALMADAGLTNGAFYAHFDSKDDLVATSVVEQLGGQRERLAALPAGERGVELFVRWYLSAEHRDLPEEGCPSAALLDEIGRAGPAVREAFTAGLLESIDELAVRLAAADPAAAQAKMLTVFAMMVGAVQVSRALTDQRLADDVLAQCSTNVLTLLGVTPDGR